MSGAGAGRIASWLQLPDRAAAAIRESATRSFRLAPHLGALMELSRVEHVSFAYRCCVSRCRRQGEMMVREGRRPRAVARVAEISDLVPRDPLRLISTWSLAILAVIAVGFVLYVGREVLLPVVAAFVVGVMLSPAARKLEALHVPRPLAALLLVAGVTLIVAFVIALIFPRVSELTNDLPKLVTSLKEKLHVFDGWWRHITSLVGEDSNSEPVTIPLPSISWVPSTISFLLPPITGFLFFLVVLLFFITAWPDLRRGLVMTFANRESRLTVLKILNDIESGLGNYLMIVTSINVTVGVITGIICRVTGLPNAIGFGALAATLNFIPIIGPIAMFAVIVLVGVVTAPTFFLGLVPAAGYVLLTTVEGNFITPTIIGRHIELNALAVLLSLVFWAWLWGPMGAFLSSPILMVGLILRQRLYGDDEH
jgi:predicted PurR-regulated permease PerM